MLTPLSTMTTGTPRSTPVVKRLPLIVNVCGERVWPTRMSASCPKAETMPTRRVHSVRQAARAWADAALAPAASKAAAIKVFTGVSQKKAAVRGSSPARPQVAHYLRTPP